MTVAAYLDAVEPPQRREDALLLDAIFREASGFEPQLWGKIVGYGRYHYRYASGREGDYLATGFHPQKARLSLYIMPGYADLSDLLARLGPHKTGKACLYITRLDAVDTDVLKQIIRAGLDDLGNRWPIQPS